MDRAKIKRASFSVVGVDDRDAGAAQGSVNGQDAHLSDRTRASEKRSRRCRKGDSRSKNAASWSTPKWRRSQSRFGTWLRRARKLRVDENWISLRLVCARPRS